MYEEFKSNMHDMKNLHIYRTISKYYFLFRQKIYEKIPESYKKHLLIIVLEISSTKYLDDAYTYAIYIHTYTIYITSLVEFYDAQSNKGLVQGHQNKLTVCHVMQRHFIYY